MKLLVIGLLFSSSVEASISKRYYKIPASTRTYTVKEVVVGYKCPGSYYFHLDSMSCLPYEVAEAELEVTRLKIDRSMSVSPSDVTQIEVERE